MTFFIFLPESERKACTPLYRSSIPISRNKWSSSIRGRGSTVPSLVFNLGSHKAFDIKSIKTCIHTSRAKCKPQSEAQGNKLIWVDLQYRWGQEITVLTSICFPSMVILTNVQLMLECAQVAEQTHTPGSAGFLTAVAPVSLCFCCLMLLLLNAVQRIHQFVVHMHQPFEVLDGFHPELQSGILITHEDGVGVLLER